MAKVQHTCTGCVPVDASVLEVYIALDNLDKFASANEAERIEAEGSVVIPEGPGHPMPSSGSGRLYNEAVRQYNEDVRQQQEEERWADYNEAEGTESESAAGDGSRWGDYKAAENARDAARLEVEGTDASTAGDGTRWGAYKTAEAARDTARENAEGTAASVAGDGTRWGAYKTAEAARNTAAENVEGTASSTAGDGSRWGAYKSAEAARDAARLAAEGTSSSDAGDGTRWGAFKTDESARNDAMAPLVGSYACDTAASTAAKTVSATSYVLGAGGAFKVKFTYANSASSPTLNVNSTGAKAIVYNGAPASASNTWGAGEVVEFYYDPTYDSNAGGFIGRSTVISVSQNTLTIGGEDKGELAGQLIGNQEWVKVVIDSEDKILYGVKTDGKFYFGDGCPPQVIEYITNILGTFTASDYADIMTFLGNLITGDTLATLLNAKADATNVYTKAETGNLLDAKVDKVTGKSLIDSEFASSQKVVNNSDWLQATIDSEGKILEGITKEGKKKVMVEMIPEGGIEGVASQEEVNTLDGRVDALESSISNNLVLTIPNVIYAVVGTELNIWNDTVSLSVDRGLTSPMNYQVRWQCNKGLITDRCFRYTPAAGDAGSTVGCSCYLYDMKNNLITSKAFVIKVLAKNALSSAKNIAYFGDSLGASSAEQLYNNFNNSSKYEGTIPNMVGTRGSTYKYDAVGGYGWKNYATIGSTAYRASVSGVTSISMGAVYSDGSHNFEVIEVNIVEGAGNILLLPHYTSSGALIMPSGTLSKISGGGDSSVPYTDAFSESGNPLWNDTSQELDVAQYKVMCGLQATDKIDAVSFQFGINDNTLADDLPTLYSYIKALYDAFIEDNPDCKFIVGLTTSSGNDVNGVGANYGASYDWMTYLDRVYRIRKFYLTLQSDASMPNLVIAPIHLEVDRYYGYAFSTRQISQRTTTTEKYHNNYVHPGGDGYGQIGDAYFATFIGVLVS